MAIFDKDMTLLRGLKFSAGVTLLVVIGMGVFGVPDGLLKLTVALLAFVLAALTVVLGARENESKQEPILTLEQQDQERTSLALYNRGMGLPNIDRINIDGNVFLNLEDMPTVEQLREQAYAEQKAAHDKMLVQVEQAMAELGFKVDRNPKAINALGKSIPVGLVTHIIDSMLGHKKGNVQGVLGEKLAQHRKTHDTM